MSTSKMTTWWFVIGLIALPFAFSMPRVPFSGRVRWIDKQCDYFSQITCANGTCIPLSCRCNNITDCEDGIDEQNCKTSSLQFHCDNGPVIGPSFVCDGHNDCGDNSDEKNCDDKAQVNKNNGTNGLYPPPLDGAVAEADALGKGTDEVLPPASQPVMYNGEKEAKPLETTNGPSQPVGGGINIFEPPTLPKYNGPIDEEEDR